MLDFNIYILFTMENDRQDRVLIEAKWVNGKYMTYYECSYFACHAKTSGQYCRHHSRKYEPCQWVGCDNRCKDQFCHLHKAERMEKVRQCAARHRAEAKANKLNA